VFHSSKGIFNQVPVPMQQQILELNGKGEKERKIARLLKVSRSKVKKVSA
jgi:DNA-binding NarL/FixJ family response regulator